MRLPVPERLSAKLVLSCIAALFIAQLLEGTDLFFALLTAAYVGLFALGFNAAGGLLYASGAFIFFNAILTAILGLTFKVFLVEPGDSHLLSPTTSMLAYCGGMAGMTAAALLTARLRPKTGLLGTIPRGELMKRAAIGCLLFGIFLQVTTGSSGEGTIGSAFRQINHFVQMGILLGTVYELQRTNGRRSTNWIVWTGGIWYFAVGLLTFGKEGMFLGTVTWAVAALITGYHFNVKQIFAVALATTILLYYFVPYSQYVRVFRTGDRTQDTATALLYLSDLNETRRLFLVSEESHDSTQEPHLFGRPMGFVDRLNMLAFDDALIHHTEQGNVFGILPTLDSYANIVPHFLWPNKPNFAFGNSFGHEIGVLADEDTSTGISFSPTGDAFHEATWLGVLLVWPAIAFLFFFVTDSLTGSTRQAPWALLPISLVTHTAPEGLMQGTTFLTTYGVASLLVIVLFARYLLPTLTGIFTGAGRTPLRSLPTPIPAARRPRPGSSASGAAPLA